MGYRLHYAKTYQVDWDGGYFNWKTDEFEDLIRGEFTDCWIDEIGRDAEIYEAEVLEYINKINKNPEKQNKYMEEYTNKQVVEALADMVKNYDASNGYIKLTWF